LWVGSSIISRISLLLHMTSSSARPEENSSTLSGSPARFFYSLGGASLFISTISVVLLPETRFTRSVVSRIICAADRAPNTIVRIRYCPENFYTRYSFYIKLEWNSFFSIKDTSPNLTYIEFCNCSFGLVQLDDFECTRLRLLV
jgi:hypothetical protein